MATKVSEPSPRIPALQSFQPLRIRRNSHLCPFCCPDHDDTKGRLSDVATYVIRNPSDEEHLRFVHSAYVSRDVALFKEHNPEIQDILDDHIFIANCFHCHNWFYATEVTDGYFCLSYFIGFPRLSVRELVDMARHSYAPKINFTEENKAELQKMFDEEFNKA